MANPYVGEIRIVGFNFAPVGWAFCNGQLLPITQYDVLFNLIGTTYGGNGSTNFGLPDLQGRMPIHMDGSFVIGAKAGVETVLLGATTIPSHSHGAVAVAGHGDQAGPTGAVWATGSGGVNPYSTAAPVTPLAGAAVGTVGGSQTHENMSPFLAVNFVISLFGIFPSQV